MSTREGTDKICDGRVYNPNSTPFMIAFSKQHPGEHRAYGFEDDLIAPFAKKVGAINYLDMYMAPTQYGVLDPIPPAPLFSNCDDLFSAMSDSTNKDYLLFRDYLRWWTDALARCIKTAALLKGGVHFNLGGYNRERVQVVKNRWARMLQGQLHEMNYELMGGIYKCVPHVCFNIAWTEEEKTVLQTEHNYPGFTDWDLA
jgi:hypothetical protein